MSARDSFELSFCINMFDFESSFCPKISSYILEYLESQSSANYSSIYLFTSESESESESDLDFEAFSSELI